MKAKQLQKCMALLALISIAGGTVPSSFGEPTTREEQWKSLWHEIRPQLLGKDVPEGEPTRLIRRDGKQLTGLAFGFLDVDPYMDWYIMFVDRVGSKTVAGSCVSLESRVIDQDPAFLETGSGQIVMTAEEEGRGTGIQMVEFEVWLGPIRRTNEITYSALKKVFRGHSNGYELVPLWYSKEMAEFYFGTARQLKKFGKEEWPMWSYEIEFHVSMSEGEDVLNISRKGTIHLRKADGGLDRNPKDISNRAVSEIYKIHVADGLFEPGM
jgi:hypothetical protein